MVESKFVVLQMIPHTLFIEWDFGHYSRHCSLAVLLFMTLLLAVSLFMTLLLAVLLYTSHWHCSLAVVKLLFTYTVLFIYTYCSYIRYYSYDQFFFF